MLRLNKAIAISGLCSRRAADDLIASGRVKVNGKIVTDFNCLVDPYHDRVDVSGQKLSSRAHEYIVLNKPKGIVSTCQDEHGRKKIIDFLPDKLRHLKPAGRLDYDSSGLIFLTNDGELINRLTHPTSKVEKTYRVSVSGKITDELIEELSTGIDLAEAKTKPAKVRFIKSDARSSTIEIKLTEGRNRQLRRMLAQLGLPVLQLVRTGISTLQLGSLPIGKWRHISRSELFHLRKDLKLHVEQKR